MRAIRGLIVACVLGGVAAWVSAQVQPERISVAAQPEELIRQLGSSDPAIRERADVALELLGAQALPALLQAAENSDDLEVRLRADRLLQLAKEDFLWQGSRVSVHAQQEDVAVVMQKIIRQAGDTVRLGNWNGKPNNASLSGSFDGPYWQVIDDICRQSGNYVRQTHRGNEQGLVMVAGDMGHYPIAYNGPVRTAITACTRLFRQEFNYERGAAEKPAHRLAVAVRPRWENTFPLVAIGSLQLVEATTDTGRHLICTHPRNGWASVYQEMGEFVPVEIQLSGPASQATVLSSLVLEFPILVGKDYQPYELDNPQEGRRYSFDGMDVEIGQLNQNHEGQWHVTIRIREHEPLSAPPAAILLEKRFTAFNSAVREFALTNRSHSYTEDQTQQFELVFSPRGGAPNMISTLQVSVPAIRSYRRLRFEWQDVPIPHEDFDAL